MAATTAAALAWLLLLLMGSARLQDAGTPLCQRPGCTCVENTARCDFAPDQVVQVGLGALPAGSAVSEVWVSGPRELHVLAGALSGVRLLQRLRLRHIGKVVLRRAALQANAEPHAILEVSDCGVLVVESKACEGLRGALMALVARCGHVLLQAGVFARLLALTVAHVPHLQLQAHALALDTSAGQLTVVNLTHVLMPELPTHTFPSSAVEVRLQDCEVVSVREEAFSMLLLAKLSLVNSSLHDVAASAFSHRTLIEHLLVTGSRIHRLRRGALLAGVTNLTIERSRIDEVESGAVNNTAALVTLQHNHLSVVRRRGFVFRKWNRLRVVNNTFAELEEDSIWAPYQTVAGAPVSELRFSENRLGSVSAGGLRWLGEASAGVGSAVAAGNVLEGTACRCDLGGEAAPWAADALLCRPAAPLLARCLRTRPVQGAPPQPALSLANFTAAVCGDGDVIVCPDAPAVLANADGEESGRRSTLLLALVLGAAAAGAAAVCGGAWLRRKRRRLPACLAALLSRRLDSAAGAAGARQAGDGSPGHEYAELQPQPPQAGPPPDEDALLPAEDKWTQTLPEELTQELLQTLRDKLDDPDNYSEARDMIEHLYDLIKVEESGAEERETGEVIRRSARCATRSTGTRAPSPPPPASALVRVCGDYVEPRDRSPDQHLYAELPPAAGAPAAAALCEYAEPRDSHRHAAAAAHVYCELPANMADRPLPSTPATR